MASKTINTKIFILILFIGLVGLGNQNPKEAITPQIQEKTEKSCKPCHTRISESLKGHDTNAGDEVKDCLTCHTGRGQAAPFELTIHFKHYSASGFSGDCRSCHQMDDAGEFSLIGVGSKEIRISKDMPKKMEPYFRSWGASKYLDNRHAKKGLSCKSCHGTFSREMGVTKEICFQCHGSYDQLSNKSSIHSQMISPHFGGGDECGRCHRAHEPSDLLCGQCHEIERKVP